MGIRLVIRRLTGAKTLVLAAAGVTLVATVLLGGLIQYSRSVVAAGAATSISQAPADERSLLVRGSLGGDPATLAERDAAVRREAGRALVATDVRVCAAGYATGRQLTGDTGTAIPDDDGLIFASIVFAEGLDQHADLVAGDWPQPGERPVETALAVPVATVLGVGVGDRIPVTDRLTGDETELSVSGIWQPRDLADPYWRLFPEVEHAVAPQSSTYGPFVLHRDDFLTSYLNAASAAWLIDVDLSTMDVAGVRTVADATAALAGEIVSAAGMGSSGLATTGIGRLADRLERADLVGRSALLTPLLLVVVLSGYALLLIAVLLTEHRRTETALIRARGAARSQIAGLVTRESILVVLPAAVLAPLLVAQAIEYGRHLPVIAALDLPHLPALTSLAWLVAGASALACAAAMVVPALRRSGTYVEELAIQSRPSRWAFAQRAALDVALVAFAAIAWVQLRQHASPLSGVGDTLGIDPLLSAAPTVAVLAGALVALRLLPVLTRAAERRVSRTRWNATLFGLWQAGRRPHAGPVLLLALAVAVSTLALCLANTAQRSLLDQADFRAGADLRVVEAGNNAPATRIGELTEVPGLQSVAPAVRDTVTVGPDALRTSILALDAEAAPSVMHIREDLANGTPSEMFDQLADERIESPLVELPATTTRLTGRVRTSIEYPRFFLAPQLRVGAIMVDRAGGHTVLPLTVGDAESNVSFDVEVPAHLRPAHVLGFSVDLLGPGATLSWELLGFTAHSSDGTATPVDLDALSWHMTSPFVGPIQVQVEENTAWLKVGSNVLNEFGFRGGRFAVVPERPAGALAAIVTPGVLAALRADVGDLVIVGLRGGPSHLRMAGVVDAVPSIAGDAILLDLPTLRTTLLGDYGIQVRPQEWWLSIDPSRHAEATEAVSQLADVRVLDRVAIAEAAGEETYGAGARAALWVAAGGAMLLALVGMMVDVRATARRRVGEFAVLRTLGAGSGLLSRALLAEQALLAGLGVVAGLLVGIGVATTMAPLVILTPSADRPEPVPLLSVPWLPVGVTAGGLLAVSLLLGALVAVSLRQRLIASQLRIGEGR